MNRAVLALLVAVPVVSLLGSSAFMIWLGYTVDEELRSPTDLEMLVGWGWFGLSLILIVLAPLIAVLLRRRRLLAGRASS